MRSQYPNHNNRYKRHNANQDKSVYGTDGDIRQLVIDALKNTSLGRFLFLLILLLYSNFLKTTIISSANIFSSQAQPQSR